MDGLYTDETSISWNMRKGEYISMTEEQLKKVINNHRQFINVPNESVLLDMIFLVGDLVEESSGDYVTANNVRALKDGGLTYEIICKHKI